jgi:hypothetical protein
MTAPGPLSFAAASALTPVAGSPGVYRASIPDGWQQGRGAFGGLILGTLLRAIECEETEPARRTRCLTGDICGPVLPGEVELRVTVLRRGKNQTNARADLWQAGEIVATATGLSSTARSAVSVPRSPSPPAVPPFADLPILPIEAPLGPVFASHYEYRGNSFLPFTGGDTAAALGTIRERTPPAAVDGPALIGLLDAYWPALYATETQPRAMATVSFAAQILVDPASLDPAERLVYRARVEAMEEGFSVEFRELWSVSGEVPRLVALNQQTFALLR